MAFRKKVPKKKVYKKTKTVTKKPWVNRNMVSLGQGFPKRLTVTHKYTEIVTLQSLLGNVNLQQWSCNGIYQPNILGSRQAMLFDQMSAVYDHYCVIASKATFKFMPANSSNNVPITCLVMLNDDTSLLSTNPIDNAEQVGAKLRFLQMDAGNSLIIRQGYSAKKTFGPNPTAQAKLTGTLTTNPSEQQFFHVLVRTTDEATTQSVIIYVEIEYVAVWSELKDLTLSTV